MAGTASSKEREESNRPKSPPLAVLGAVGALAIAVGIVGRELTVERCIADLRSVAKQAVVAQPIYPNVVTGAEFLVARLVRLVARQR